MAGQVPKGRGAILLEMLKKREEEKLKQVGGAAVGPSGDAEPIKGKGRAAVLKKLQAMRDAQVGAIPATEKPSPSVPRSSIDVETLTKATQELAITQPTEPVQYRGTTGRQFQASANYIGLDVEPDRGVFEYEVRFTPDIDAKSVRIRLLNEILGEMKRTKVYDGDFCLYLPAPVYDGITEFESKVPHSGDPVKIIIIFKRKKRLAECLHLYNVLFKRIMHILLYKKMGRNYFAPSGKIAVPQHKLEILPGYAVSVDEMEGGLMVCLDTQHRVIRTQSVYEFLGEIHITNRNDFHNAARQALIGSCVLTTYNNMTYILDDIAFNMTPRDVFDTHDGGKMSFMEYYKAQYNIDINDDSQPLIIHTKKKTINGEKVEQQVCLIPELCNVTGMTDAMRNDFKVMKDVAAFTRITPHQRILAMKKYIDNVRSSEECQTVLGGWGLKLRNQPISIIGRALPEEVVIFRDKQSKGSDWSRPAIDSKMCGPIDFISWHVYYTPRDRNSAANFVDLIKRMANGMGCQIAEPKHILLQDDRNEHYMSALRENLSSQLQFVVFICPTMRADRYALIKKICCCQTPIPSQIILGKTLGNPQKVRTIVHKIAMQITAKMGGSLWRVAVPISKWMIIGIDVYHGVGQKSVCGFVASCDDSLMRWFSEALFQEREIGDFFKLAFHKALQSYKKQTGSFPTKIVIFRDGVGDGQLSHCKYEVNQFYDVLKELNLDSTITFVVIQKRINTRIFEILDNGSANNPPAGTVVDHTITRRNYKDFYLIPQSVRQGTVNPTHYIVLHDDADLKSDHLQRLAYKLCHLYYNWTGIIKVPAPCLYAHKLASLVGMHLKKNPSQELNNRLYYL